MECAPHQHSSFPLFQSREELFSNGGFHTEAQISKYPPVPCFQCIHSTLHTIEYFSCHDAVAAILTISAHAIQTIYSSIGMKKKLMTFK